MPNDILTVSNVVEETQIALGSSGVDVELAQADIEKAMKDALRLYNRSRPFVGNAKLAITRAQKKYGPIDTLHGGLMGVREVRFDTRTVEAGEVDPFNPHLIQHGHTGMGGDTGGEIAQRLAYAEDVSKVMSAEPEAQPMWEPDGHLYIYVDIQQTTQVWCSYVWTAKFYFDPPAAPDPVPAGWTPYLPMTMIPEGDTDWFMDFVLARAKQTLAKIRGKFEGIPNPDGGQDPVDWSALNDEGKERERELTEEMKLRRRQLPPVTG